MAIISIKLFTKIVKIHDPWDHGSWHRVGLIWPYSNNIYNLKILFLCFHICLRKLNVHDVDETLYQNWEMHGSSVRGSDPRSGPTRPHSEITMI